MHSRRDVRGMEAGSFRGWCQGDVTRWLDPVPTVVRRIRGAALPPRPLRSHILQSSPGREGLTRMCSSSSASSTSRENPQLAGMGSYSWKAGRPTIADVAAVAAAIDRLNERIQYAREEMIEILRDWPEVSRPAAVATRVAKMQALCNM